MLVLERISPRNALIFKAVRLRALQDTPSAFGSTYAKESQLTDEDWIKRGARWSDERSAGFLAIDKGDPCGIACSFLDEGDATRAQLISMWTAPTHRKQGIGRRLVDEVIGWALLHGARSLEFMVVSSNERAFLFYERLGFARTGRTESYPNDPDLVEYEMSRVIV